MAKYRKTFSLQPRDIEIIENALRSELTRHAGHALSETFDPTHQETAAEINQVLAKIYHQKMFFSQVRRTGVPGG
ncbi:MAG: hypothetical protein AB7O21_11235 [Gammaproteobacteria bacterium]